MLDGIFKGCKDIVSLFKKCRFFLSVSSEHDYDQATGFTEQNVTSFLGEIEEFISLLIVYVSFKRDEPHAAISSIPLERLQKATD